MRLSQASTAKLTVVDLPMASIQVPSPKSTSHIFSSRASSPRASVPKEYLAANTEGNKCAQMQQTWIRCTAKARTDRQRTGY